MKTPHANRWDSELPGFWIWTVGRFFRLWPRDNPNAVILGNTGTLILHPRGSRDVIGYDPRRYREFFVPNADWY